MFSKGLLAWALGVGFCGALSLEASILSIQALESLPACAPSSETQGKVQDTLEKSYERIRAEKRVYSWELVDRNDRVPHYCIEQCGCLAEEFLRDLGKAALKEVRVHRLRVSGGPGLLPVRVQMGKHTHDYHYHVALLVEDTHDGCFAIYDALVAGSKRPQQPFAPESWSEKIVSLAQNQIFTAVEIPAVSRPR